MFQDFSFFHSPLRRGLEQEMMLNNVTDTHKQKHAHTLLQSGDQVVMADFCVSPVARGFAGVKSAGSPNCGSIVLVFDAQLEASAAVKDKYENISEGSAKLSC